MGMFGIWNGHDSNVYDCILLGYELHVEWICLVYGMGMLPIHRIACRWGMIGISNGMLGILNVYVSTLYDCLSLGHDS